MAKRYNRSTASARAGLRLWFPAVGPATRPAHCAAPRSPLSARLNDKRPRRAGGTGEPELRRPAGAPTRGPRGKQTMRHPATEKRGMAPLARAREPTWTVGRVSRAERLQIARQNWASLPVEWRETVLARNCRAGAIALLYQCAPRRLSCTTVSCVCSLNNGAANSTARLSPVPMCQDGA